MSRKVRDLSKYPMQFMDIANRAHACEPIPKLQVADRKMAISTRHNFNRFRLALIEEGVPNAPAAMDLVVRIEEEAGQHYVVFVPRGLWKAAQEQAAQEAVKELQVDLPQPQATQPEKPRDGMEEFAQRYLEGGLEYAVKGKQAKEGEQGRAPTPSPSPCNHEWDVTQAFCLKCKRPWSEKEEQGGKEQGAGS